MSETVQAALIGASIGSVLGLIGVVITNHYAEKRRKSDLKKWYADHFLGRKIDALSQMYSSTLKAKASISRYRYNLPESFEVHKKEVEVPLEKWDMDKALAWVYLSNYQREILNKLRGQFRLVRLAIWIALRDKRMEIVDSSYRDEAKKLDWEVLDDAYRDAGKLMEELLSPDVLKGIEPKE